MPPLLKNWKSRAVVFLAVVGPGLIVGEGGNDAGGIWTYSVAGARFGYSLLWAMVPATIGLIVVQLMAARMAAVTGKGLSDLIREEFGFRVTFILMLALVVTNFGSSMAGIASFGNTVMMGAPFTISPEAPGPAPIPEREATANTTKTARTPTRHLFRPFTRSPSAEEETVQQRHCPRQEQDQRGGSLAELQLLHAPSPPLYYARVAYFINSSRAARRMPCGPTRTTLP